MINLVALVVLVASVITCLGSPVLFLLLLLVVALVALAYRWVISEDEYKAYGLPWYKRPAAFWYGMAAIGLLSIVIK